MLYLVLNTPLEIHEKNKEKQPFLLIHTDTLILLRTYHFRDSDSTKCTKMSKKKRFSENSLGSTLSNFNWHLCTFYQSSKKNKVECPATF